MHDDCPTKALRTGNQGRVNDNSQTLRSWFSLITRRLYVRVLTVELGV